MKVFSNKPEERCLVVNGETKIQKVINRMGKDGLDVTGFRQRLLVGFCSTSSELSAFI